MDSSSTHEARYGLIGMGRSNQLCIGCETRVLARVHPSEALICPRTIPGMAWNAKNEEYCLENDSKALGQYCPLVFGKNHDGEQGIEGLRTVSSLTSDMYLENRLLWL